MLLILLILPILIGFEISFNYKKRICWIFVTYLLSTFFLFAIALISIIKIAGYHYVSVIDYRLYLFFKQIPFNLLSMARWNNLFLALLMLAAVMMCRLLSYRKGLKSLIILTIPIVIFLILNEPKLTYRLFLYNYSPELAYIRIPYNYAQSLIQGYSLTVFIAYMLFPFLSLGSYLRKTKLHLLHENALIAGVSLTLLVTFLIYNFVFGMLSYVMPWKVDLNKFPLFLPSFDSHLFLIPILILLGVMLILLSIRYKSIGGSITFLTKRRKNREFYALNHNLRMIFHTNKNILYTVKMLAGQSVDFYERSPEIVLENIRHIESVADKGLATVTKMLSLMDELHVEYTPTGLRTCLENAVTSVNIPDNIELRINFPCDDIIINASEIHFTESFSNILKNAVETIEMKGGGGTITINLKSENHLAVIEFLDDGLGIERREIKKMFSMLYSSKKTQKNWGIGLSYVKRVVDIYNGYIYVKSVPGKYTLFQILLPIEKEDL